MVKLYGIRNCDTMNKARRWLEHREVPYELHDYKKHGIDAPRLELWCRAVGWESLLNRSGTTFRKLPERDRSGLDENKAMGLMLAHPSMIKRPVLETGDRVIVGFSADRYEQTITARR